MRWNGIADAAADGEAELVVFDDDTVDWVQIPESDAPTWLGGYRLPLPVVEADHIINLPLVKTHFIAGFTMALKNMLGLPHPADRAIRQNLGIHRLPRLWSQIAEVNAQVTTSLNILDGYRALITGGPNANSGRGATYADPKVIFAAPDSVAIDVAGISLLHTLSPSVEEVTQTSPWQNPQIGAAAEYGVGIAGPEHLALVGPTVPDLDRYREIAAT